MKPSNAWIVGLVLIGAAMSAPARAADACAGLFDKIADELDAIAASYDRIKTSSEVCSFARATDIPSRKRILATIQANQSKCDNGAGAVNMARTQLREATGRMEKACRAAKM